MANIIDCFLKGLETFKVPARNVSTESRFESKDWVVTRWDESKLYVRLLDAWEKEPSAEGQAALMTQYGCDSIAFFRNWDEIGEVLGPIFDEIDEKSGAAAERELRHLEHLAREKREHEAAVARKAEKQRLAEIRREKQLEKARLWHQEHDTK